MDEIVQVSRNGTCTSAVRQEYLAPPQPSPALLPLPLPLPSPSPPLPFPPHPLCLSSSPLCYTPIAAPPFPVPTALRTEARVFPSPPFLLPPHSSPQRPMPSYEDQGLAAFGIVLTGRLQLKNELMSTLSVGKEVWEDRYVVLTRKGIHFYFRQPDDAEGAASRGVFGQHTGSVGLAQIERIDATRDAADGRLLRCTIVSKGEKRKHHFRAATSQLLERWYSALQNAIAPKEGAAGGKRGGGQIARTSSGHVLSSFSSRLNLTNLNRVPTFADFRKVMRTDNVSYVSLCSSRLSLEVLLESGLPWGLSTIMEPRKHHLDLARDSIRLVLEGGGSVTIPLSRTLKRSPSGSATFKLDSPALHKRIRFRWEPSAPPQRRSEVSAWLKWNTPAFATLALATGFGILPSVTASDPLTLLGKAFGVLVLLLLLLFLIGSPLPIKGHPVPSLHKIFSLFHSTERGFAICFKPDDDASFEADDELLAERSGGPTRDGSAAPPRDGEPSSPADAALAESEKRDDLHVDALFAEVASAEHSILHVAANALHAVKVSATTPVPSNATGQPHAAAIPSFSSRDSSSPTFDRAPFISPSHSSEPPPFTSLAHATSPMVVNLVSTAEWDDSDISAGRTPPITRRAFNLSPFTRRPPASPSVLRPVAKPSHSTPSSPVALRRGDSVTPGPGSRAVSPCPLSRDSSLSEVCPGEANDLNLHDVCAAFEAMVSILGAIGPSLMIQVRNDNNNVQKLRAAMASTGSATVCSMLEAEVAAGMHVQGAVHKKVKGQEVLRTGGGTLADPSGAIALLWLTRSLHFTLVLVRRLLEGVHAAPERAASAHSAEGQGGGKIAADGNGDLTEKAIKSAYNQVIRPYHSWLLRGTFDMMASQVPHFSDIVDVLGSGLGEVDREVRILHDMQHFCDEGFPIVKIIMHTFERFLLEDLRKV
ncbi:hypothetical protein AB1Y20_017845 [Prymnesium parvum]|uniref:Pleckstrin homology domain-containing family A member 8 n=1 Tax=Prymnesium parvum TaxID=97485 RepID=A0AB34JPM1_PRYPA